MMTQPISISRIGLSTLRFGVTSNLSLVRGPHIENKRGVTSDLASHLAVRLPLSQIAATSLSPALRLWVLLSTHIPRPLTHCRILLGATTTLLTAPHLFTTLYKILTSAYALLEPKLVVQIHRFLPPRPRILHNRFGRRCWPTRLAMGR